MRNSAIYKIQSIAKPEKIYVGSAISVKDRWRCHLKGLRNNKHHSIKLQNHFNKYGELDLVFIIIEPCFPEFLLIREQHYIDKLKPWFNICPTAGSQLGTKRSPEQCERIRLSHIGQKSWNKGRTGLMSAEGLRSMGESKIGNKYNFGKKCSAESIQRNRESHLGQTSWSKGKKYAGVYPKMKKTDETKDKMSKKALDFYQTEKGMSVLKNRSEQMKIRIVSDETKAKLREINLGENSPSFGMIRSEETLQKMRAAWVLRKLKKVG